MSQSLEAGLRQLEQELRRVASMPPISGGAPISAESALEQIIEVVSNISPSGGVPDLSAIAEDVLPATDATHDLGSATHRWAEGRYSYLVRVGDEAATSARLFVDDEEDEAYLNLQITGPGGSVELRATETGTQLRYIFTDDMEAVTAELTVVVNDGVLQILTLGLPTIDPVQAGALWNDNGTMKVSAGA